MIDETRLRELAAKALIGCGATREHAEATARILVWGDLLGVHTHGVDRVPSYGERLRAGGINANAHINVERVSAAMATVDGDDGLGPAVGMRALEAAMAAARETGVGVALARRSNHFGAVAPYSLIAAEQGFASIIGSNSTTTIAPTGGKDTRLGNSPVAFCVPHPGGRPFVLDMAVSVVARAKIRDALKQGRTIPDSWATDKDGRPTTDPKAALDGFLLPIGAHKGYGLALAVDLFAGLLSGANYLTHVRSWLDAAAPQGLGHFFILIDTRRLGSTEWLAERMADFAAILHETPPADPANPVKVPGEIELDRLERARREGIAIDKELLEKLERLAG